MPSSRLRLLFFVILIVLGALASRLFYIQILQGPKYSQRARKQFLKKVKSEILRGVILDRNGHVLATSIRSESVGVLPRQLRESVESAEFIRSALSMDPEEFDRKIKSKDRFVWLERKLSPGQINSIKERKIRGLEIVEEQKRYYPNGSLACHLLGTVGIENYGLSGIEQALDPFLKGKSFTVEQFRDGKGRRINPSPGRRTKLENTVVLTIDRTLQFIAERELARGVSESDADSGMALIQNPKTGEILAMASYPEFDPNLIAKGSLPPGFDNLHLQIPVVTKMFEPGSTFKIVTFSAALNERQYSLTDSIDCERGIWNVVDGITIRDHEKSAKLPFPEVLEKSSNIGTGKIGMKLGKDKLYRYVLAFGFGTRTGICLPGETKGLVRLPGRWSAISLPVISFGQEIGVTAIQLIGAFSAIANDGMLMEPHVVKRLLGTLTMAMRTQGVPGQPRDGEVEFLPQTVRRVISPETARSMRMILRRAVDFGTGKQAQVKGYSVGGKTGTAQKINPKTKKYYKDRHIASFCGFLPAEEPALVCLVILDNPKRTHWGGESAAPVFSRIMSRAAQILGIPPEEEPRGTAQTVRTGLDDRIYPIAKKSPASRDPGRQERTLVAQKN